MRALLLTACAALLGPLPAQAPRGAMPPDSAMAARLDEYMQRLEALGYSGGLLVLRDGRTVIVRSYGFADREAGVRADTSTVFSLGSITKQFTAAAILRLEELGKLHTTDSIGRFFADVPADKRGITLHHLLTHTSGLESDFSPGDYEPTTREEYVRRALVSRLRTRPGAAFFYSNAGYSLLAAVVELRTGTDYESALSDLVLRPAGMLETGYRAPRWGAGRIAHGYQGGRDWGTIAERISVAGAPYWALRGNGGLHTTLRDMRRWNAALDSRRVLDDSSRKKFFTPYVNEGPAGLSQYAYGWAVTRTPRGTRLVTHNGGNGVYVAELLRFVDEGVTVFLTSTVSELPASPAVRTVERIVFGASYELPPKRVDVSSASLDAMAGSYSLADGSHLVLRVDGGRLLADGVGQQAFALLGAGDTTSSPRAKEFNVRAEAIVAALSQDDVRALHGALDDPPDMTELGRMERGLMSDRRNRLGALHSIEALGTVPSQGPTLLTTVRLAFERGMVTNVYAWNAEARIVDVIARPYQPVELIPTGGHEFASFSLRPSAALRLHVETTPLGGGLVAETPGGPVRLSRGR